VALVDFTKYFVNITFSEKDFDLKVLLEGMHGGRNVKMYALAFASIG